VTQSLRAQRSRRGDEWNPERQQLVAQQFPRARQPSTVADFVVGLQQTAGNAAVAGMLRPGSSKPTAPRAHVQAFFDDEEQPSEGGGAESDSAASAEGPAEQTAEYPSSAESAAEAGDSAATEGASEGDGGEQQSTDGSGEGPVEESADGVGATEGEGGADYSGGAESGGAEGDGEHSAAEQAEKGAEGEHGSETDEYVPTGGGGFPVAGAGPSSLAGFSDGGRQGTVPFQPEPPNANDLRPHAFVNGGKSGTKAWAGGGGAGPKGNQQAGSIQNQVPPEYESEWGGPLTNASAWVKDGTGVADVTRSYVTSDAGDQGNGWYVTPAAAVALEKHEQSHVQSTKDTYSSKIQPALDKVANSRALGKEVTYKSADAREYIKRQVGWASAIKDFSDTDMSWNNPNTGQIDLNELGAPTYPHRFGPVKVGGKDYPNLLKLQNEADPK
jgi:hypothetical protein